MKKQIKKTTMPAKKTNAKKKSESKADTASLTMQFFTMKAIEVMHDIHNDVYQTFIDCDGKAPTNKQMVEALTEMSLEQVLFRYPLMDGRYDTLSASNKAKLYADVKKLAKKLV